MAGRGLAWLDVAAMDWQGRQGKASRGLVWRRWTGKAGKQGANKTMNRETDNALLLHGGSEDIDIPAPAIHSILADAICSGELARENEALKLQVESLEEHNQALAKERDFYRGECRKYEDRLNGREFE